MTYTKHSIEQIRNFLEDEEIQDELSLFDIDLSSDLDDELLVENFERALTELPADIAKRLRKLDANLAKISHAADVDAAHTALTGRIAMTDRAMIVQETVAEFSRGLEDLRGVASDFADAIKDYHNDTAPLLDRQSSFDRVKEANKLLSDLWQQSLEVAKRLAMIKFRQLTNGEDSPEITQLRSVATGRFVIDKEIYEPMREYTKIATERENALRKKRDQEFSHDNDTTPLNGFSPH